MADAPPDWSLTVRWPMRCRVRRRPRWNETPPPVHNYVNDDCLFLPGPLMAAVAQSKLPPRNAFPFFDDRWKMEQLWKVSPVTRVCQTKDERHTSQKSPVLGLPLGVRPRFRSDFDFYFFLHLSCRTEFYWVSFFPVVVQSYDACCCCCCCCWCCCWCFSSPCAWAALERTFLKNWKQKWRPISVDYVS